MRRISLTLGALCALLASGGAWANGVDLYNKCGTGTRVFFHGGSCQNFVGGAVAGIATSPHPNICFPTGFDGRQSLPIIQAYMRNHPEALNQSEVGVIRSALRAAYPCSH